jgi:hypothetical protein
MSTTATYSRPDTRSALSLYVARNQRKQLNAKTLLISYSLWIVGDTPRSTLSIFLPNTLINTDAPLRIEMGGDILIAKRRTAMERNILLQFNNAWKCLLDITDLYITAYDCFPIIKALFLSLSLSLSVSQSSHCFIAGHCGSVLLHFCLPIVLPHLFFKRLSTTFIVVALTQVLVHMFLYQGKP